MLYLQRTFVDNYYYDDAPLFFGQGDALSEALGWLTGACTLRKSPEGDCMENPYESCFANVKWYQYMTCVYFFHEAALVGQPKTIEDYVKDMWSNDRGVHDVHSLYRPDIIEVISTGSDGSPCYKCSNMSQEFVECVIWGAYVFHVCQYHQHRDDPEFHRGANILYRALRDVSGLTDEYFKEAHELVLNTSLTIDAFRRALIVRRKRAERAAAEAKAAAETAADAPAPEPIDAANKVRMELACRLIERSAELEACKRGDDAAPLSKHGAGASMARLVSVLTGISVRECQKFVTNRDCSPTYHHDTIVEINKECRFLDLGVQL